MSEWISVVSIHATLAGGDPDVPIQRKPCRRFLSTPPSRVATGQGRPTRSLLTCFYPRHPRGWRLPTRSHLATFAMCFYPRHPRGWRPVSPLKGDKISCFYPRHPRGWRLLSETSSSSTSAFLSTPKARAGAGKRCFYPRHPRGWRLLEFAGKRQDGNVSIHATLAGGDASFWVVLDG